MRQLMSALLAYCGLLLLTATPALALEAFGEGSAVIIKGDVTAAKAQEVNAALAEAAARHGAVLHAEQETNGQQLKSEHVSLKAQARIRNYSVVDSSENEGVLWVKIRADVEPAPARYGERRQHRVRLGVALEEMQIGEDRFRLTLSRMAGPYFSAGAEGEMVQEIRHYAEAMRIEGGYDNVVMDRYKEYLRSGLLTRERVAEAEITLKHER